MTYEYSLDFLAKIIARDVDQGFLAPTELSQLKIAMALIERLEELDKSLQLIANTIGAA